MPNAQQRLSALSPPTLTGLLRGVEKESLRVRPDGGLAATPHPAALGSALTHPRITTDFSESQLELITGVHASADACVAELTDIHQFVYRHIGDEAMWASSMPCRLPEDDEIPIGRYGSSNLGRIKTVYRTGLSHRYGRRMQTISGVHYNFSLPDAAWEVLQQVDGHRGTLQDYRTEGYFALIRNFRRSSWLPLYLFGTSPAACRCFVEGRAHALQALGSDSVHLPHATSLRMGRLGYQSDAQASLRVSFNGLASYARSLQRALTEPYPAYEAIGIMDGDRYLQLATTLLQIENEFYGTIRPKRRIRRGERPLHALTERGVEYVEVRSLDVDPYAAVGVAAATMHFLDAFLLCCLLSESPPDTAEEIAEIGANQYRVAERGREPGLALLRGGREVALAEWGMELVDACAPFASALDAASGGHAHRDALAAARAALDDPAATPSARVLREIERDHGNSYADFAVARSLQRRGDLLALPYPAEVEARFRAMADESLAAQRDIEAADRVPFETYRQQYLAQDLLAGLRLPAGG
ncbi:MAG: glutamate--cysteine ligase [Candidatus Levyibacteriota bacterium]